MNEWTDEQSNEYIYWLTCCLPSTPGSIQNDARDLFKELRRLCCCVLDSVWGVLQRHRRDPQEHRGGEGGRAAHPPRGEQGGPRGQERSTKRSREAKSRFVSCEIYGSFGKDEYGNWWGSFSFFFFFRFFCLILFLFKMLYFVLFIFLFSYFLYFLYQQLFKTIINDVCNKKFPSESSGCCVVMWFII